MTRLTWMIGAAVVLAVVALLVAGLWPTATPSAPAQHQVTPGSAPQSGIPMPKGGR